MGKVTGIVEMKSRTGKGIKINDEWYNSRYPLKCEKGDIVEFDDGGDKWCNKLKVVGKDSSPASTRNKPNWSANKAKRCSCGMFPIAEDDGDRTMIRRHAVSAAIDMIEKKPLEEISDDHVETIIYFARKIEAYTSGDIDKPSVNITDDPPF